ncbi:MAG: DUF1553 domain-containing protein, partial [Planctomycetaceae bacterium]|nr:DUF1553 domain-containing protein [Planctomycetaceae bacterium]
QQASRVDPRQQEIDADNRLLWRYRSRRLEAEAIRDSMLLASGQLNFEAGGPGFNFFQSRGGLYGFPPLDKFTGAELRRMIYSHKIRMEQVPVFGAFDCPDAGQPAPRRSQSTTAIQALNLLNSDFVHEQAVAMASRLVRESRNSENEAIGQQEAAVKQAFRRSLGRAPSDRELSAAVSVA